MHNFTCICWEFSEIAINGLDLFLSHYQIESTKGMADPPQIGAGRWSSADGHLPGALEPAQRVDAGRTGQLSSTEIEPSNGKEAFVADDSFN